MAWYDDISGVGPSTADHLEQEYGIDSIEELGATDPSDIDVPTGNADVLVKRANQMSITSDSMADVLSEYDDQTYIPTGLDPLNDSMDGGWEPGTIGLIYGKSGQGKTQLAFSAMAEAASEGPVIYIQTEHQSRGIAQRIADMADDPDVLKNITRYEAYSVEDQYAIYGKIEEEHPNVEIIVIDSFTGQFRVTDDYSGRENLGDRSEEMGRHLTRVGEMARSYDCPVILIGQVHPTPEAYGKSDNIWGGEKFKHFVSYYVRMSNGKGVLKEATLENHPGKAESTVSVNITDSGLKDVSE